MRGHWGAHGKVDPSTPLPNTLNTELTLEVPRYPGSGDSGRATKMFCAAQGVAKQQQQAAQDLGGCGLSCRCGNTASLSRQKTGRNWLATRLFDVLVGAAGSLHPGSYDKSYGTYLHDSGVFRPKLQRPGGDAGLDSLIF